MDVDPKSPIGIGRRLAAEVDSDVVFYNGPMDRAYVLNFAQRIFEYQRRNKVLLFLVTDGGDPDAAYKMMRYLHRRYQRVVLAVSGVCKSAGTLAALGAHEVAFAPYGELGPLDIQQYKTDNLSGMESGLTISEAIDTLARKAMDLHREHYTRILNSTGRVISFTSAAKVATELTASLFSPIFDRIDPYDVGQKARSMRIANSYGERLARVGSNLKDGALDTLTRGYPSHSFVIDMDEAQELFNNVRALSPLESELVASLGTLFRTQVDVPEPFIHFFEEADGGADDGGEAPQNADGDRQGADEALADAGGQGNGADEGRVEA